MTLQYVEGDLFAPFVEGDDLGDKPIYIAHLCNDQGGFSSGFVVPLAATYPVAKHAYLALMGKESVVPDEVVWHPPNELGEYQLVKVSKPKSAPEVFVANMIAQTLGGSRPLFYHHLAKCMDDLGQRVAAQGGRIVCPMFGSGLAGADWNFVEKLIEDCWLERDIQVTVYYLPQFMPDNWQLPEKGVHNKDPRGNKS